MNCMTCPPADDSYGYNHLRTSATFRDALADAEHTFAPSPDVIIGGDVISGNITPVQSWTLQRPTPDRRERLVSFDESGAQRPGSAQNQPWRGPRREEGSTWGVLYCSKCSLWTKVMFFTPRNPHIPQNRQLLPLSCRGRETAKDDLLWHPWVNLRKKHGVKFSGE